MISYINGQAPGAPDTRRSHRSGKTPSRPGEGIRTPVQSGAEQVALSNKGATAGKILAAAKRSDGIDHARVDALRTAIHQGRYTLSPTATADGILRAMA